MLTEAWDQALSLAELRRARALTQEQLASALHLGGDLERVARFPDHPPVRVRLVEALADNG